MIQTSSAATIARSATRQLKLGWLLPYSAIFRRLRTDLEQGFSLGWGDGQDHTTVVPYPAFIQSGGLKDSEDALKKLILHDQVDLVIGVLSTKVALHILPLLARHKTPLLLLNLGGDIPTPDLSSPYLLYNSLHLWKSEWAMGKWAQERYGREPAISLSAYEGGYGLSEAYKAGVASAGAATVKLNIVRNFSPAPDVSPLLQYLTVQQPAHTHALLSGQEGQLFFQLFHQLGLHKNIPLTANPFLVEGALLPPALDGATFLNAITWSPELDTPHNLSFVGDYQSRLHEEPNVFALLAYEAGLVVAEALQKRTSLPRGKDLATALADAHPSGPRNTLHLSTTRLHTEMPVYIRQSVTNTQTGRPSHPVIAVVPGIECNDPSLPAPQEILTGWQNPYLCV